MSWALGSAAVSKVRPLAMTLEGGRGASSVPGSVCKTVRGSGLEMVLRSGYSSATVRETAL